MQYVHIVEAARLTGLSLQVLALECSRGNVPGAQIGNDGSWWVPELWVAGRISAGVPVAGSVGGALPAAGSIGGGVPVAQAPERRPTISSGHSLAGWLIGAAIAIVGSFFVWWFFVGGLGDRALSEAGHAYRDVSRRTLLDESRTVHDNSWFRWEIPLRDPSELTIEATVTSGRGVTIYVVDADDAERVHNRDDFSHYALFHLADGKAHHATGTLPSGRYAVMISESSAANLIRQADSAVVHVRITSRPL